MKYDKKILKFLLKNSIGNYDGYLAEELSEKMNIPNDQILVNLRHLKNLQYISVRNRENWVGDLDIDDQEIHISSKGIVFLEEDIPKKIKFWFPIIISSTALIISIITILVSW